MADCRLPTMPFEVNGKTYILCCNMNVLADVEQMHNGNLMEALDHPSILTTAKEFLAAMLNDYAVQMHWEERYTPLTIGRLLPATPTAVKQIRETYSALVYPALTDQLETDSDGHENAEEDAEKNAEATQS